MKGGERRILRDREEEVGWKGNVGKEETNLGEFNELGDELVEEGGVDVDSLDSTATVSHKVPEKKSESASFESSKPSGSFRSTTSDATPLDLQRERNSRLSRIKERPIHQLIHRVPQIRILPHVSRILPTQLQPNSFEVLPSSSSLINALPTRHGPRERDERDGGGSDEFEGRGLIESEDLEGCWGKTSGEEGLLETGGGGRGLRGGFDEDGVS